MSLTDVSEQIHIRSVYLQALEDENWTAISAPVYVRGFLRTYARFLGMDGDKAVERFSEISGTPKPAPIASDLPAVAPTASVLPTVVQPPAKTKARREQRAPAEGERSRPSPLVLITAVIAVALVAFVCWTFYQVQTGKNSGGTTVAARSSPTPATTAEPTPARTAAPLRTLALRVTKKSWIHVDIDGKPALEGIFEKGWAKEFHGVRAAVSVGNAGGVDVEVNGKDKGLLGHDGEVLEKDYALGV